MIPSSSCPLRPDQTGQTRRRAQIHRRSYTTPWGTIFARELPQFVARVRSLFTPEELQTHIARIEHERIAREALSAEIEEQDDPFRESPKATAERTQQFSTLKELLTAAELGTS